MQASMHKHKNKKEDRRLCKGPKVIAGVCSGIAQYFNIDAVIVRIIWALLCVFSLGLGLALYVVLAIIMPESPKAGNMVDCTPTSVQSDKYCNVARCQTSSTKQYVPHTGTQVGINAGAGHIPPPPPQGFQAEDQSRMVSTGAETPSGNQDTSSAKLALILGLCLVAFFGVCAWVFARTLPGVSAFDLFPVLFVALGVVLIAVPTKRWCFTLRISGFLFCLELCLFLLPFTLGIVPLGAMTAISPFAVVCWVATAGLFVVSLVSSNQTIVIALVVMFLVAMIATFIDIGVIERTLALVTLGPPHKNSIVAYTIVYTVPSGILG